MKTGNHAKYVILLKNRDYNYYIIISSPEPKAHR